MTAHAAAATRAAPIDQLYVAPENARAELPAEDVDELARNIHEYGLLQPLVAYQDDSGRFAIVGGRRRLAALNALAKAAESDENVALKVAFDAIPLREIAQDAAIGASLAENTQRVDLGVVEAALQFNRMTLDGKSVAEIAKVFGVTERFVQGRMRLANLHQPILEALRKGEISLDVAQAYAGAVTARQERVWKALSEERAAAWRVKAELKKNTLLAGDALAKFVGEEAYAAAGGVVEHELFLTPDMSRWLDPALAERLAQEKLKETAAALEAEGFLFVETAIEIPHGKYVDGNFGKPRKSNSDEAARLKEIAARQKALAKERKAIDDAADEGDRQYTEAEDARIDAIEAEQADLDTERRRIEAGRVSFDEKAKERSGVIVTIDDDGRALIQRGLVAPKERRSTAPGKANGAGGAPARSAAKQPANPEPQAPMTNLTHEKTSRIASTIVGRALADNPAIALVALAAQAAREIFFFGTVGALTVQGFDRGENVDGLLSEKAAETAHKRWQVALGKNEDGLEEKLAKWPQADVLALLAYCVGQAVKWTETNSAHDYSDAHSRLQLISLAKLAGANPAAHFIPDAAYLAGYSKAALDAAAAELGLDSAGLKTKTALAEAIADKAKGGGATAAWVPPLLRTLCGMPEAKAKPAVAKKAAKSKSTAKAAKPKKTKKPAKPQAAKAARTEASA